MDSSFPLLETHILLHCTLLYFNPPCAGDFATPGTSHHRGPSLNNYQWVMTTLGAAIGFYSKSHEVPVHGFGGQYQLREHEIFQCGSQAKAKGVTGLMEAYDNVFSTGIVFGDRCKYDSVIMAAAHQAQKQLVRFISLFARSRIL
jgi:Copine